MATRTVPKRLFFVFLRKSRFFRLQKSGKVMISQLGMGRLDTPVIPAHQTYDMAAIRKFY